MCMFSRRIEHVAATKIFARGLPDGRQVLAYAMDLAAAEALAMILPLPVPPGGPDDAVEFVDLEGYAGLFADLRRAFPEEATVLFAAPQSRSTNRPAAPVLPVHAVGAFEASYVPSPGDFDRLDPRFRLPPGVLEALPGYADWGFAVFQLRRPELVRKRAPVHPMALRFPRRDPDSIYFPTTHVHDGTVPATAAFDHALYAQLPPLLAAIAEWPASTGPLGAFVHDARAQGLIDGGAGGQTTTRLGPLPNGDLWLRPPAGVALADLAGAGSAYAYRVHATYCFQSASHHLYPRWLPTAQGKLAALCRGLREGLADFAARRARAWQLAPLTDELPPHFMNGSQLWRGTSYMNGSPQLAPGPGRVAFRPFTDHVEPQDITLGFAELPTPEDAIAINRELMALLDRAVG